MNVHGRWFLVSSHLFFPSIFAPEIGKIRLVFLQLEWFLGIFSG